MNYLKVVIISGLFLLNILTESQARAETTSSHNVPSFQIQADGTKIIQGEDGSLIKVMPDGSKLIKKTDGTTIEVKSDGSKSIKRPDGTSIEVPPGSE